ncbi:MAG: T9SS type A sorting domain-containing protein [Bacteroidetes bacterium]|nr:T9SS type A sorting domain-containing protein [Bacteroidota bacterium]
MKKQTIKLAALALLLAASAKNEINAQASVAWRTQLNNSPFTYFEGVNDYQSSSEAVIDTLSNKIYRFGFDEKTLKDFDPGVGKVMKSGAVVAAYSSNTGALDWVNNLTLVSKYGGISIVKIVPIGKQKGLYIIGSFSGKIKYQNTSFTSTNTPSAITEGIDVDDLFVLKINENGTLIKSLFLKPDVMYPGSFAMSTAAVDVNGSLAIVFTNYTSAVNGYLIDPLSSTKQVILGPNDVGIVKYDSNLKFINSNKIVSYGEEFSVDGIFFDGSKNFIISGVDFGHGFNQSQTSVDFDAKQSGAQKLNGLPGRYIAKYSPSMQLLWTNSFTRTVNLSLTQDFFLRTNVDKQGNIFVSGILGDQSWGGFNTSIDLSATKTLHGPVKDSLKLFVAKYDKLGTLKTVYSETKYGIKGPESSVDELSFFIDSKNNAYLSCIVNDGLYMSKLNTAGNSITRIWKNSIFNVNPSKPIQSFPTIIANKNEVYLFANLGDGHSLNTYKDLVNNPLSKFSVAKGAADVVIKYTLSGTALSPEEQIEENNNVAYKTGLEESSMNVSVYPNPATDFVTIKVESTENTTATIYNYSGVAVKTIALAETETKVNISELPAGMYFVEVVSNGNKEVKKVIKQ